MLPPVPPLQCSLSLLPRAPSSSPEDLIFFFLPPNLLAIARVGEASMGRQSWSQERSAARLAKPQTRMV